MIFTLFLDGIKLRFNTSKKLKERTRRSDGIYWLIARNTFLGSFDENENVKLDDLESNISYSACVIAKNIKADAIVCYTNSGDSARRLAGMGAGCPILAITDNRRTFNQLALAWNVTPVFVEKQETIDKEILEKGDTVVLASGSKMLENNAESKIIGGVVKI